MRAEIFIMGILICIAGGAIAFYGNFQFLGEWYFPNAMPGAIVLLIGFVTCVVAFGVSPAQQGLDLVFSEDKEEASSDEIYSPLFYISGHPDFNNRNMVQMVLTPQAISLQTMPGSSYEMNLEIPIKPTTSIDVQDKRFKLIYQDSQGVTRYVVVELSELLNLRMSEIVNQIRHFIQKTASVKMPVYQKSSESIEILKARYAKGEVTKEQYEEMKKTLEQ